MSNSINSDFIKNKLLEIVNSFAKEDILKVCDKIQRIAGDIDNQERIRLLAQKTKDEYYKKLDEISDNILPFLFPSHNCGGLPNSNCNRCKCLKGLKSLDLKIEAQLVKWE
jgi:hypothetical protein